MVPQPDTFPYTMLLQSEVLESNGSTSMGATCGSTLALLDAGVPIKAPVAGIAMGLIAEGDQYAVLTDIQGMEDFSGDMDFKVAGTAEGITALQLDTKIQGIPRPVFVQAFEQAREARLFILDKINEAIPAPRANAPRIITIHIDPEQIGTVIGPGGKTIKRSPPTRAPRSTSSRTARRSTAKGAKRRIESMTVVVQAGEEYEARWSVRRPGGTWRRLVPTRTRRRVRVTGGDRVNDRARRPPFDRQP